MSPQHTNPHQICGLSFFLILFFLRANNYFHVIFMFFLNLHHIHLIYLMHPTMEGNGTLPFCIQVIKLFLEKN